MKAVPVANLEELVRNWRKSCCAVCEHTFCQTVRHQANELSALAAVDVPVESQGKSDALRCKLCNGRGYIINANSGQAVNCYSCAAVEAQGKPDARPVIGPNTYRGEDGSVSVLGTSTGVAEPTMKAVPVEIPEALADRWIKEFRDISSSHFGDRHAELWANVKRQCAEELKSALAAAAVDVPVEAQETAWLIERTGPQWFCISGDRPFWSSDSLLALRFSRERDAKHAMAILNLYQHHGLCATEHRWGL